MTASTLPRNFHGIIATHHRIASPDHPAYVRYSRAARYRDQARHEMAGFRAELAAEVGVGDDELVTWIFCRYMPAEARGVLDLVHTPTTPEEEALAARPLDPDPDRERLILKAYARLAHRFAQTQDLEDYLLDMMVYLAGLDHQAETLGARLAALEAVETEETVPRPEEDLPPKRRHRSPLCRSHAPSAPPCPGTGWVQPGMPACLPPGSEVNA